MALFERGDREPQADPRSSDRRRRRAALRRPSARKPLQKNNLWPLLDLYARGEVDNSNDGASRELDETSTSTDCVLKNFVLKTSPQVFGGRVKSQLVTHTGERIVADSMAQLERRRAEILERHANELRNIDDKIGTIKLQEVEALKKQASALRFP